MESREPLDIRGYRDFVVLTGALVQRGLADSQVSLERQVLRDRA